MTNLINRIFFSAPVQNFFSIKPRPDFSVSKKRGYLAFLAIAITQLGDALTTIYGISVAGANEANGIMADFISRYGLKGFLYLKLFAIIFLGVSTFRRKYAPLIIASIYALVVVWNLLIIFVLA
jgi:hypothetical protein